MTGCPHHDDAGAWVLDALAPDDARRFAEHLPGCLECRQAVTELQGVADVLPMAAPQVAPPPALKGRIMAVVESEAQLLRAAGPQSDRAPAARPGRRRSWLPAALSGRLRPLPAIGLACAVLVVGVVSGLLLSGGGDSVRTYRAQAPRGAEVVLRVQAGRGTLDVRGMPAPPAGHVYQVWLAQDGANPRPTHALWVPRQGRATVEIGESLDGADRVLVTAEPSGGSDTPTSAPVVRASLS